MLEQVQWLRAQSQGLLAIACPREEGIATRGTGRAGVRRLVALARRSACALSGMPIDCMIGCYRLLGILKTVPLSFSHRLANCSLKILSEIKQSLATRGRKEADPGIWRMILWRWSNHEPTNNPPRTGPPSLCTILTLYTRSQELRGRTRRVTLSWNLRSCAIVNSPTAKAYAAMTDLFRSTIPDEEHRRLSCWKRGGAQSSVPLMLTDWWRGSCRGKAAVQLRGTTPRVLLYSYIRYYKPQSQCF